MRFTIFLFIAVIFFACKNEQVKGALVTAKKFYPNKQLMEYREFRNDMKNGKQIAYWDNGNKRFEFNAVNDAYEGELKEWDYNGNLFHLAHYENGQEEGVQKLWYENGKIRANYVILKGRRYGLLGTKNCKNVSDSIFNRN
jgi:antitoxin component YwqK of YwqJK toxin-antitoxin module